MTKFRGGVQVSGRQDGSADQGVIGHKRVREILLVVPMLPVSV